MESCFHNEKIWKRVELELGLGVLKNAKQIDGCYKGEAVVACPINRSILKWQQTLLLSQIAKQGDMTTKGLEMMLLSQPAYQDFYYFG